LLLDKKLTIPSVPKSSIQVTPDKKLIEAVIERVETLQYGDGVDPLYKRGATEEVLKIDMDIVRQSEQRQML
jgi:hypothetical protein